MESGDDEIPCSQFPLEEAPLQGGFNVGQHFLGCLMIPHNHHFAFVLLRVIVLLIRFF